jgi:c-di-GMP-binding flagellar brake protein YcgR
MATPVGRIEREFYLKVMYDEKVPIKYIKDRLEYVLTLEKPSSDELIFRPDRHIENVKPHAKLALIFNYRGQTVDFTTEVKNYKDDLIYCITPDKLHKNLDRNYLRVDAPSDLKLIFTFRGDRYNLGFPRISEYENVTAEDLFRVGDPKNLADLLKQLTSSLKNYADGYKVINFKDKKPETLEELIVSQTGKALFIPSTIGRIPSTDPYPRKRVITEEMFKRYLESTGVGAAYIDEKYNRFIKKKYDEGIYSDAWIPMLFHEYVIGYIHIWIDKQGRLPFDYNVLDNLYQFSKVLAFSLKENGYFEQGKIQNEPFEGRVLDMSASGLLFAYPLGTSLLSTLLVDSDLSVSIEAPNRTINVVARIVRRFKDKTASYYGCRFTNMVPEDTRFLFEHLYGRQIDDQDAAFLSGQV